MRVRKVKDVEQKLNEYSYFVLFSPETNKGQWNQFFENNNPIYLEIGMGKGKFISESAQKNPDINYIGCERSQSILLKAARKIDTMQLKNLVLLNVNANILDTIFEKGEISKIFLNFSDPWPKPRHAKRRLTSDEYLKRYMGILKNSGSIEMKTDNQILFEYSLIKFNQFRFVFSEVNLNLHSGIKEDIITTEYEDRFKSLGNTIYYIKVEKWI